MDARRWSAGELPGQQLLVQMYSMHVGEDRNIQKAEQMIGGRPQHAGTGTAECCTV